MGHDAQTCTQGNHSNRGLTAAMCPIFLEERNRAARQQWAEKNWTEREARNLRTNQNRRRRERERKSR